MFKNYIIEQMMKDKKILNAHGIGKDSVFMSDGMNKVELPSDVLEKLLYGDELEVYTNDKIYVVVKEKSPLYKGMVDKEGVTATIVNDILETPEFMSVMLAIANEDRDAVFKLFETPGFYLKYIKQMSRGYLKGNANGHY
ncbi:hypothetical protein NDS46_31575 (plasmid) [Paenibacillus thiaminolyticus]|uniref:hypothetical protein n=1 Tax=Paenibacillus thiaminolyticus TaxID=49283 RepID=UPI00232C666F|nr:hypothetical protein [Paenibacillus thiaminolyticus]WCF11499.1 hypothetical protein NDS46_31575 [Paenibacillus thiaminolyticus]